jgi:hypothetical protein
MAILQNVQQAMAQEQLRQLQMSGTPDRRDVEMQVQMYYLNPEGYSGEQIISLAQRAAAAGVAFEPKTSTKRVLKNIAYGAGSGATFGLLGLIPGLKPDALTSTEQGAKAVASALGIAVGGPAAVGGKIAAKGVGALAKAAAGTGRVAQLGQKVQGLSATGQAALESGLKYGFAGTTGTVLDEGLDPGRGVMMGSGAAAIAALRTAKVAGLVGKQQTGFTMQGGTPAQTNMSKELWQAQRAQGAAYTGPVNPNRALVPTQQPPVTDPRVMESIRNLKPQPGQAPAAGPKQIGAWDIYAREPKWAPSHGYYPMPPSSVPAGTPPAVPDAGVREALGATKAVRVSTAAKKATRTRIRNYIEELRGRGVPKDKALLELEHWLGQTKSPAVTEEVLRAIETVKRTFPKMG